MCSFIYLRAKFKIHHQFETELEIHPYQVLSTSSGRVDFVVVVVVVVWTSVLIFAENRLTEKTRNKGLWNKGQSWPQIEKNDK